MELYDAELKDAKHRLAAAGRDPADFDFAMEFLPPDPDGAGMFTVLYEVRVGCNPTGYGAKFIGGIGMHWVDSFAEALQQGAFDA